MASPRMSTCSAASAKSSLLFPLLPRDGAGHTTAACNHTSGGYFSDNLHSCWPGMQDAGVAEAASRSVLRSLSICTMLRPLGMLMRCHPTILKMIYSHQAPVLEVLLRPPRIAKRIRGGMHAWLQSADSSSSTHAAKKTKTIYRLKTTTGHGPGRPCHI